MSDDLLKSQTSAGGEAELLFDPYNEGLRVVELTNYQIIEFGTFFNGFYKIISEKQNIQITRNALTMIQGAIFALGTKNFDNPEWKEHCASSLREIFHEWSNGDMSSDFTSFYKSKDTKLTEEERLAFREFKNLYEYFSGVDHHNASKVLRSLIAIKKDQSIKFEFCYKDETFVDEVKDFFSRLSKIISFKELL